MAANQFSVKIWFLAATFVSGFPMVNFAFATNVPGGSEIGMSSGYTGHPDRPKPYPLSGGRMESFRSRVIGSPHCREKFSGPVSPEDPDDIPSRKDSNSNFPQVLFPKIPSFICSIFVSSCIRSDF